MLDLPKARPLGTADEYSNFSPRDELCGGRGMKHVRQIVCDVLIEQIMNIVRAGKIGSS